MILLVAGLGTWFLPASKSIPKEMVTVVDRPAIEYVVCEAVAAGIEQSSDWDDDFAVLFPDVLLKDDQVENNLAKMIACFDEVKASKIMVEAVPIIWWINMELLMLSIHRMKVKVS